MSYVDEHFDVTKANKTTTYIKFIPDVLLNPNSDEILLKENLSSTKKALGLWNNQASGISIPEELAFELENQWNDFQGRNFMQFAAHSNSGGSGYGNHLNNVLVETAAIDTVRRFYLKNGWKVKSVECERC